MMVGISTVGLEGRRMWIRQGGKEDITKEEVRRAVRQLRRKNWGCRLSDKWDDAE